MTAGERLEEIALLLGPVGVAALLPIWFAMVLPTGWRHLSLPTKALGLSSTALLVAHWTTWWFGFDWVDGEPVPNSLFAVSGWLIYPLAVAFVLLFNGCVTLYRSPARPRAREGG